jgi:hypothetical protein
MVTAVINVRSKRDNSGRTILFRVKTDAGGFKGKVKIQVGAKNLPDEDADIAGEDSTPFKVAHSETKRKVVKVTAGNASSSVILDLDAPASP